MPMIPLLMSKLSNLSPKRSPRDKRRAGTSTEPAEPMPSAPSTSSAASTSAQHPLPLADITRNILNAPQTMQSKKRRVADPDAKRTPFPDASPRTFPPPPLSSTGQSSSGVGVASAPSPSPRPPRASIPASHKIRYLESKVLALSTELEKERTEALATKAQVDHAFRCVIAIHEMITSLNDRLERLERAAAGSRAEQASDEAAASGASGSGASGTSA
ncbi:uncharacterized protein LOC62_02G001911 [Vanrija pseudolonga]|uniref:Uncharacterized protein n=1 Tax=Vanrija pseudolonga TaxID=143232 RepID=A0AAF0Y1D8_9TREE|nr:hypothetical protein LOC62_02G001911 [Vanrija pseudolonga]